MNEGDTFDAAHVVNRALAMLDGQMYAIVKSQPESKFLSRSILYTSLYREVQATTEFAVEHAVRDYMVRAIHHE